MKKLMITAGAVAIAAGAFATAPTVYDYKASVKHMYLKEVTIRDTSVTPAVTVHVYQKIQKTSSLKGYLIQDTQACLGGKTTGAGLPALTDTRAWDQRRNRAFLVVLNSSATPAEIRQPKILPAVLEAKFMDKALTSRSYLTEGMLFVGGDFVGYNTAPFNAALRPYLMPGTVPGGAYAGVTIPATGWAQSIENPTTARPRQTAKGFYGDYLWTSAYLFGQYNGPQWSTDNWSEAERKLIVNCMPQFMKPRNSPITADTIINPLTSGNGYFHDTWMNHAGFGTGIAGVTEAAVCCGLSTPQTVAVTLDSLSGNLKGGMFLCSENGFYTGLDAGFAYGVYRGGALWEDQFWAASINRARSTATRGDVFPIAAYFGATGVNTGDLYQMDVWTDGDIEALTTDVMSGTWSIKRNTRLRGVALTQAEITGTFKNGAPAATPVLNAAAATQAGFLPAQMQNAQRHIWDFNEMLKAAAVNLSRTVIFANGTEISSKNPTVDGYASRFENLPMITPKFAIAYGLDGQHLWQATPSLTPAATPLFSIYQ